MASKYFTDDELKCKCNNCKDKNNANMMNDDFMQMMDNLREKCNFGLIVSSAYRCKLHNADVSSTGLNGPHTTGRAIDILIGRKNAYIVLKNALELGFTGIGIKQTGDTRFIHLDNLTQYDGFPRPTLWSY